ncbi:sulfite exporter TauE/SafE family protein [Pseudooceanicola sp. C21-150M6]|uniref:sulfite exporter TauE/SafE family protein n=1 Tax=Pseudooceanicola sp. C21-150M6 TaxID=3434355 RepID=UPI003D7F1CE4
MPDWLPAGVEAAELALLLGTVYVAGVVYGFAGFGAALLYMPIAARIIPLDLAIAAFAVSALASLVTVVPQALPLVHRRGTAVMIGTAVLASAAGIMVLKSADLALLRWVMVGLIAITLLALVSGWRYRAEPSLRTRGLVGLGAGFMGGATGLLGPVMVLFQLAGQGDAARNRASTLVFLTVTSVMLLPLMWMQGVVPLTALWLGLVMLIPYALGTTTGRWLFRPHLEKAYRLTAYILIGVAALAGLPLFD